MNQLKIIKLDSQVKMPEYHTAGAVAFDLRAFKYSLPTDVDAVFDFPKDGLTLGSLDRVIVRTGLKFDIPEGCELQVRPRSGLAAKHGISVVLGTVDSDYQGEVFYTVVNLSKDVYTIHKEDRLAQAVLNKIEKAEIMEVKKFENQTERGENGMGSTGKQ